MNKINWKVRFKNKVWLGSFLSLIVGFAYSMLALFDVLTATGPWDMRSPGRIEFREGESRKDSPS